MSASKHLPSVYLPKNAKIIRLTKKAPLVEKLEAYITESTQTNPNIVFVVPLIDWDIDGKVPIQEAIGGDRTVDEVSISHYDMSAVASCSRVCFACEELWSVL